METLQGRGRVYVVPAPVGGGRWVVRPYRRGGAMASWLGDRYLRVGTPRPMREFAVGRAVEDLGIPTPPHIGAAVYPSGLWYRGDLVTQWVPDSRDLAAVLFAGHSITEATSSTARSEMQAALAAAGSLIRLLHDRGVVHRDLNLKNILISAAPIETSLDNGGADDGEPMMRALVLDLDRATLGPPVADRGRRRMLDRFWRSARKWESRTGRSLGPALRAAFEAGYGR